jgi:hypothetical protein
MKSVKTSSVAALDNRKITDTTRVAMIDFYTVFFDFSVARIFVKLVHGIVGALPSQGPRGLLPL